ncbi:regulatory protein RecX [Flavobacteriaceae bacterium S356]|uniref:Regulatory protein RecX n=1 Tax=Asprobacillus argus TaxID=3076534 RepID=A0ABU3LG10_9FLAO|nr:regulatory protein RecX [Flavobacteriaceae bacterium S356]
MQRKVFTIEEVKRKMEHYCVYQDRCHQEVEEKLREFSLIVIAKEEILLHLMEHDFLNETRFAQSYARGKFRIKKYGKQRIIRELKRRNITAYNIKKALLEIEEDVYRATAFELAIKKNASLTESNTFKKRKKLFDHMVRKGYEYDLINEAIDAVLNK